MLTELLLQRPTLSALSPTGNPVRRTAALPSEEPQGALLSTEAYRLDIAQSSWQASRATLLGQSSLDSADTTGKPTQEDDATPEASKEKSATLAGDEELSEEDQRKVDELEKIDREVHTHEQTHVAAAGGYARGGAQYQYANGPDGQRYAVAGHVNMDTGRENSPEETLRKAMTVQKAALAPANPSSSDRQIAAAMAKMAQEARSEMQDASANKNSASHEKSVPASRHGTSSAAMDAYNVRLHATTNGALISLVA